LYEKFVVAFEVRAAALRQTAPHGGGPGSSTGISERSRIAVKGLTALHDDAVDSIPRSKQARDRCRCCV